MEGNETISQLKAELEILRNNSKEKSDLWSLLIDRTKGMTTEEWQTVLSDEKVSKAQTEMFNAFMYQFLFEKYKNEFSSLPAFEPLCTTYVNEVLSTRQGLYANNKSLLEENQRLREELSKLRGNGNV